MEQVKVYSQVSTFQYLNFILNEEWGVFPDQWVGEHFGYREQQDVQRHCRVKD